MKKIICIAIVLVILLSIVPTEGYTRRPFSNDPVIAGQTVSIRQSADARTVIGNAYASNSASVYQGAGGYGYGIPYRTYGGPYYGGVVNIVNIFQISIASSIYGDAVAANTATVRQTRRFP